MIRRDFIKGSAAVAAVGALSAVSGRVAEASPAASIPEGKRMRARELGLNIGRYPCGRYNAITDVSGVRVGHTTIIKDGEGPVSGIARTGVSAVIPGDDIINHPFYAGMHSLNGNGEMTGSWWVEESGLLGSPIMLTNTHSVGVVRDTVIDYYCRKYPGALDWMLPVVAETWDGFLSDINGFHVKPEHVISALDNAASGPVAEGCVGGGTGMCCHEFKGGIGTSSRVLPPEEGGYTIGVMVQANYGRRPELTIAGAPVGREIPVSEVPGRDNPTEPVRPYQGDGSIIVIVATDAPLLADQCKRLARRAGLGVGITGSTAADGSGDIFIAFSTGNRLDNSSGQFQVTTLNHARMNALFTATVEATHEAIINALCMATTTKGIKGRYAHAIPLNRLRDILKKYNCM
ncbi:P1 family peptidase [Mailhella massiliensis]|uniref:DmpA family aminopeptidase n=1 Tax=Mailhella massiliensis TaxID=1903261 RepID=UPI001185D64D|nr:P1 family peptidase [Mailhella massiliensis]